MDTLSIDTFIKTMTYLPMSDVINICLSNSKFHDYCISSKYYNNWKLLINDTYSDIDDYQNKIKSIRVNLNLPENSYNYLIYVNLIKTLDPITQLIIYYRQNDIKSFEDIKFTNNQRFWAILLLVGFYKTSNAEYDMTVMRYKPDFRNYMDYIDMVKNGKALNQLLIRFLRHMIKEGNVLGVRYALQLGAKLTSNDVKFAIKNDRVDVIKYFI